MSNASAHPYAASAYVRALAKGSEAAVEVPAWGACVLSRPIPLRPDLSDGLGAYPMTPLRAGADLRGGLDELTGAGLVSVVLVPDPLAGPSAAQLTGAFTLCRPFKTHELVDRTVGPYEPSKHHRERIRRAERRCRVETTALAGHQQAFIDLYAGLIERHAIVGVAAFSDAYFVALAEDVRMTAITAFVGDEIAAMTIWFEHGGVAYNHLTASNALGYSNGANFALYDTAIAHFASADRLNLGGGAGANDDPADGLAVFKRGFANAEAKALLCGAVLDEAAYASLAAGRPDTGYFPAYRG